MNQDPSLINEDLAPTSKEQRTWTAFDLTALWIGMVACVPTYMLAGGLVELGMSWWQAVLTVSLGNLLVLIPMILTGHAGAKFGIPFPVLARASFGIRGAQIPSILRALVAAGWFGIQTWIGGSAIFQLLARLGVFQLNAPDLPILGIRGAELFCFLLFWALQVAIVWHGMQSIRWLERFAAPFLLLAAATLFIWAYSKVDGLSAMLSAKSAFAQGGAKEGQFWRVFFPSLTGMVGFWATLSLNIPDFTRYARSQRDQILGQAIGLPLFMTLFSFLGVAVTSATVTIFGEAIPDPTVLLGRMDSGWATVIALLALSLATLSTNLAANIVSPANSFLNLSPQRLNFRLGALLTAALGIVIFPWKLIETSSGYIFTWLVGYSALLGPIGGILLTDYYIVRRTELDVEGLYSSHGPYTYRSGFHLPAIGALLLGIVPNIPGFLAASGLTGPTLPIFESLYTYAWFVGFFLSSLTYLLLRKLAT